MSLVSLRRACGLAVAFVAVAYSATLNADTIYKKTEREWRTWGGAAHINNSVKAKIYLGCLDASNTYSLDVYGYPVAVPAGGTFAAIDHTRVIDQSLPLYPAGTSIKVNAALNYTVVLTRNAKGTVPAAVVDSQVVTLKFDGLVDFDGPSRVDYGVEWEPVFSLKPGGPGAGKERIVNERLPENLPPVDPGQTVDVFGYIPNYQIGEGGKPGAANGPVGFGSGGKNGSLGVGVEWHRVTVPSGTVPGLGFPPWVPGGSNGTTQRTGVGVDPVGFFYSPMLPPSIGEQPKYNFNANWVGDQMTVTGGNPGNQLNIRFPKGYVPIKDDLRNEAPPTSYNSSNLDACFAAAAIDQGIPPPGMGPGGVNPELPPGVLPWDGNPTLPPGVQPGPDIPTLPPGMIPGGGGGGLPPGIGPLTPNLPPGGGQAGGTGTPGSGGGSGGGGGGAGGGFVTLPAPSPPDGQAPAQLGDGLPGDDAGKAGGDTLGKRFTEGVKRVQDAAGKFAGVGTISPGAFGQSSGWSVSMTIQGRVYHVTVPTDHAYLVRGLLLLLLTAYFIVSMYQLLLGGK